MARSDLNQSAGPAEFIVDRDKAAAMVDANRRMWKALNAIEGLSDAARLARDALAAEPEFDAIPPYVAADGDLAELARELKAIAETGKLPDGEPMTPVRMLTWAEGWLLTLVEIGVSPA